MTGLLSSLSSLAVLVFAVSSMLSVGVSYTVQEILGPLRNQRGVIRALVANFVLVPLLAFAVAQLLSLDQPQKVGLFLIATAAGAPFLIKLTQAAEGNLAVAATLLVLLLPVTVVYMGFGILFPAAWWLRGRTARGVDTEVGRGAAGRRAA